MLTSRPPSARPSEGQSRGTSAYRPPPTKAASVRMLAAQRVGHHFRLLLGRVKQHRRAHLIGAGAIPGGPARHAP